jgi:hypothetical protein
MVSHQGIRPDIANLTKSSMAKYIVIVLLFLSGCKPIIYLSGVGEVVRVNDEYIDIVFLCENFQRPDCYSIARFSKSQIPYAYVGQKIVLQSK